MVLPLPLQTLTVPLLLPLTASSIQTLTGLKLEFMPSYWGLLDYNRTLWFKIIYANPVFLTYPVYFRG